MAQTLPPTPLPEELIGTQGPAAPVPSGSGFREHISQMAQNPMDDFLVELMSIADELGVLDEAFQPPSVSEQVELQSGNNDPMEFLSREQLTILVQKFLAIPEPQRSQLKSELEEKLPPQAAQRIASIIRLVQGEAM